MLNFLAKDTVNDVAIIKTSFAFNVRYGLQVTAFDNLESALKEFYNCQRHALSQHFDDGES